MAALGDELRSLRAASNAWASAMTPLGPVLEYDLFRGTWSLEGRLGRAEGSSKSERRSSFSEGIDSLSSSGWWVRRDLSRNISLYSSCAVVMIAILRVCVYRVCCKSDRPSVRCDALGDDAGEWTVLVKGLSRVQGVFRGVMCECLMCKKRMNRVEVE